MDHRALAARCRARRAHQTPQRPRPPRPLARTRHPPSPAIARPARRPHHRLPRHRTTTRPRSAARRRPTRSRQEAAPTTVLGSPTTPGGRRHRTDCSRSPTTRSPQPAPPTAHQPHRRRRTPDPRPRLARRHVELGQATHSPQPKQSIVAPTTSPTKRSLPMSRSWLKTIEGWHAGPPNGDVSELLSLIGDIAAYRERAGLLQRRSPRPDPQPPRPSATARRT